MTHQNDYTFAEDIATKGLEAIPELMRVLINNAMQVERTKYLQAGQYERTEERQGHANGFKPKTVKTRVGEITFAVPQVREGGFYPTALEKGLRSERALTITLAEMYVQGVSTRKVKAITEQLCGVEISATQVSRATAQLDHYKFRLGLWLYEIGCYSFKGFNHQPCSVLHQLVMKVGSILEWKD